MTASCGGPPQPGDRMFDHFTRATAIQSALIVGDLEGARRPAAWLAEHQAVGSVASGSEPWLDALRESALEIRDAESVDAAADATARLGASCAGCHTSSRNGPRFRLAGDPPAGEGEVNHMIRNLWAMDRMWEGLIGAAEDSWRGRSARDRGRGARDLSGRERGRGALACHP